MLDPPNSVFSAFAFVGFVMSVIPVYWHVGAGNVGTSLYMFWSALGCLNMFINSRIWNGNVKNSAPVWCDISTRVILAGNVAMPATVLCITRQLYMVTGLISGTLVNKRREVYIDLAVGLGIPILEVLLSCIVQDHRFDLLEDVGCWYAIANTPPAYPLLYTWPIVIGLVSSAFGISALYRFFLHRRELRSLLTNSKHSDGRYIRLTILVSAHTLIILPLATYNLYNDAKTMLPWTGWQRIHADVSAVSVYPAAVWKRDFLIRFYYEVSRWSTVLCAYLFFALFGTFSQEALEHYRRAYRFARPPLSRTSQVEDFLETLLRVP
ncbi:STE3-like pheromone receptor [Artomyces pyxidatus]|uniref:STE3-like pheromone receptor n=1 Tax=Artomyces pyxidatus TaxID=48021 RepID=A0ACB8SZK2_9AGAM|nr:STE3-like pheromone receptor [Artomyces pyxidatus]